MTARNLLLEKHLPVKERLTTSFIDGSPGLHHSRSHRRSTRRGAERRSRGGFLQRGSLKSSNSKDCLCQPFAAVTKPIVPILFSPAFSPVPGRARYAPCQGPDDPSTRLQQLD